VDVIGFLGTGRMGMPMCANLVRAGHVVVAHDLRAELETPVSASGARWASTAAEAAAVADVLITIASLIGALFLVIPGVILFTLFAITGPVVNIEHLGAIPAMKRSAGLVRPHFWLVFFLVTLPLLVEHQAIHWAHELVFGHALIEVFIVQGITGMIVGSFVGLVEVNVAYALVAQDRARIPSASG